MNFQDNGQLGDRACGPCCIHPLWSCPGHVLPQGSQGLSHHMALLRVTLRPRGLPHRAHLLPPTTPQPVRPQSPLTQRHRAPGKCL